MDIGDYDSFVETETEKEALAKAKAEKDVEVDNGNGVNDEGEKIMKTFEFEAFDVKTTVRDEKFDDDLKALQNALIKKQEEFDQTLADFDQQVKDLADKVTENDEALTELKTAKEKLEGFQKSVFDVFGEESKSEDWKQALDTEKAFRESEIKRALKFGGLIDMIDDQEKELKFYETLDTVQISKFADKYYADFEKKYPEYAGVLNSNKEEIETKPNPGDGEEKPKKLEQPRGHYLL